MGRPKICNPCCNGGAGSSSSSFSSSSGPSFSTVSCLTRCIDSVAAARYTATLSGITAGTCAAGFCTEVNRTWTLLPTGAGSCIWSEIFETSAMCGGQGPSAGLSYFLEATRARLDLTAVNGVLIARWTKNMAQPYDCLASHTLTLLTSANCNNIPGSVTVDPA